jgi:hypothetical protein
MASVDPVVGRVVRTGKRLVNSSKLVNPISINFLFNWQGIISILMRIDNYKSIKFDV